MKLGPGVQIGAYQIVEQVGRGGMATVFKAYQPALERMVAIKVLPEILAEDPQFRERFRREAVAIAKLRHPSILAVFDHGEFEDQLYIVTEFVEGGTFADNMGKPLGATRTISVLEPIASALDYAHGRGVLHRDVKPSNILVTKEGAPVLGDFGLARMMAAGERITRIDMVVGTPEYMSPEQCAGRETGPASDQYSLGVVAYEALTGHVPYHAETPAAVMLAQMQSPLPLPRSVNPELSDGVELALMRALAKEPGDRFAGCTAFVEALAGASLAGVSPAAAGVSEPPLPTVAVQTKPAAAPPAAPRARSRVPVAAAAAALIVLVAAAGIVYAVASSHSAKTSAPAATGPAHGQLLYAAKLTSAAWSGGIAPSPDPAGSMSVGYGASSIDLKIMQSGGGISAEFDGPALKNYVADFVFKTDAGSDFDVNWQLLAAGPGEAADVELDIAVAQESMTLYLSPYQGSPQALAASVPMPGIQTGRTTEIWAVVSGGHISLYLSGHQVTQGTETTVTGPASPTFYMNGTSGALHILSLRYYAPA